VAEFFGIKLPANPWAVSALIVLDAAVVAYLINLAVLWLLKRTLQITDRGRVD
jgi:hypothetical protein